MIPDPLPSLDVAAPVSIFAPSLDGATLDSKPETQRRMTLATEKLARTPKIAGDFTAGGSRLVKAVI